jgi:hypothetical protein
LRTARKCWYSNDEVNCFDQAFVRDAGQYSRLLISKGEKGIGLTEEESDECLGLEHLLSKNVKRNLLHAVQKKKCHAFFVLLEQDC